MVNILKLYSRYLFSLTLFLGLCPSSQAKSKIKEKVEDIANNVAPLLPDLAEENPDFYQVIAPYFEYLEDIRDSYLEQDITPYLIALKEFSENNISKEKLKEWKGQVPSHLLSKAFREYQSLGRQLPKIISELIAIKNLVSIQFHFQKGTKTISFIFKDNNDIKVSSSWIADTFDLDIKILKEITILNGISININHVQVFGGKEAKQDYAQSYEKFFAKSGLLMKKDAKEEALAHLESFNYSKASILDYPLSIELNNSLGHSFKKCDGIHIKAKAFIGSCIKQILILPKVSTTAKKPWVFVHAPSKFLGIFKFPNLKIKL